MPPPDGTREETAGAAINRRPPVADGEEVTVSAVHEAEEHQIGYKVLRCGTPVEAADGAPVGKVVRVLDNAREHIFDGIVISAADGRRFVDAPEVARITDRRVVLTIPAVEVPELPRDPGITGALGAGMRRTGRRWRRRVTGR